MAQKTLDTVTALSRCSLPHFAIGGSPPGREVQENVTTSALPYGVSALFQATMLLYIVKCLGVLFWVGDGVNPLDGPLFEFGQVSSTSFDFADAAGRHA